MNSIDAAGREFAQRIQKRSGRPVTPAEVDTVRRGAMAAVGRTSIYDLEITHPLIASAVDMVERWAAAWKRGEAVSMVLTGPRGTGKSTIARAVLSSLMSAAVDYDADGNPVVVPGTERPLGRRWKAADLIPALVPGDEGQKGRTMGIAMSVLVGEAPVFVIDDVGAEATIPFVAKEDQAEELALRYLRLIDFIYERNLRAFDMGFGPKTTLVVTSNLSCVRTAQGVPSPLESLLGGRAWNRLQEMAPRGFMLDLTGVPSYRSRLGGYQYEPEAEN